ncbi:hypothetical protein [Microbacterium paludicola]|uniref:hypothetical protein n=1 Tax=Microbacterium paludicola TaxID=300019 RepID=UPI0011A73FFF|nr:hypothetical protein [Microbacterium paludicola]
MTKLAELREGEVLTALDGKPYAKPLTVAEALGSINVGSPVWGVRLQQPTGSGIEWVLYPGQMDGHHMTINRYGI